MRLDQALDSMWMMLAAVLVMLMQVGFVLLEVGSTRAKNAGHIAVKQVIGFSVAALAFWVAGYAVAFGEGKWIGTTGWFLHLPQDSGALPISVSYLFQFAFLAVSLAIAWGGFAERGKMGIYIVFGAIYSIFIYPVVGHWVWGEHGWLHLLGKQDFAGSTVVHLQGGVAALVATMMLKPRLGKFDKRGMSVEIPGHNQVYTVLGVFVIWFGWFGFNPGSATHVQDGLFAYAALTTNLAAAAGALTMYFISRITTGKADISATLNGALSALVAITAPCAFVRPWAAVVIGAVAGTVGYYSGKWFERKGIDDPVSAASVHGAAGVWGTLSCGIFAAPDLVKNVGIGRAGLFYGGGWEQLAVQALGIVVTMAFVAAASFAALWVLEKVIGLRVSEHEERNGLDLSEHGRYGYISLPFPVNRVEAPDRRETVWESGQKVL
ncbi:MULTISPECIES: ammonium transporter [Thermoactinomyces]|jgi:Amt family ammonium transporter|uniref:Ammonium transporter n=1 Tax=Thermoactinomyces daqus TaxID=1329516 RepID=A0A7W1X8Q4_9BACL|nr:MULTISPECIES: ammonium transporter [Thermoactinomyces]MBA4542178.1 ammonium transporter [Thermoactinomyces daqus]MBH8598369.1 ammonium transporter [Thermoactinomyces sp. CICC 10523]MBH8607505.1 ammonium transporter [Thermoactinomyces sp. CICC 10521]